MCSNVLVSFDRRVRLTCNNKNEPLASVFFLVRREKMSQPALRLFNVTSAAVSITARTKCTNRTRKQYDTCADSSESMSIELRENITRKRAIKLKTRLLGWSLELGFFRRNRLRSVDNE